MSQQMQASSDIDTVESEKLHGKREVQPLIQPTDEIEFVELFPCASEAEMELITEIQDTCLETMAKMAVPRFNMVQAIQTVEEDIDHATAAANGPRPGQLKKVIANRNYDNYGDDTQVGICQLDSLIKHAIQNGDCDQQVIRTAFKEFKTALDYQLERQ